MKRYAERALSIGRVYLEIAPSGRQSGYDWILQRYPREMRAHRHRATKGANLSAIAVHIDADSGTVEQRHQQLAEALNAAGESARKPEERIAIAVPRRNIETWLYGLSGVAVDETYDFKRDPAGRIAASERKRCDERIGPASEELHRLTRPKAPTPPVSMPALVIAVGELRRLES